MSSWKRGRLYRGHTMSLKLVLFSYIYIRKVFETSGRDSAPTYLSKYTQRKNMWRYKKKTDSGLIVCIHGVSKKTESIVNGSTDGRTETPSFRVASSRFITRVAIDGELPLQTSGPSNWPGRLGCKGAAIDHVGEEVSPLLVHPLSKHTWIIRIRLVLNVVDLLRRHLAIYYKNSRNWNETYIMIHHHVSNGRCRVLSIQKTILESNKPTTICQCSFFFCWQSDVFVSKRKGESMTWDSIRKSDMAYRLEIPSATDAMRTTPKESCQNFVMVLSVFPLMIPNTGEKWNDKLRGSREAFRKNIRIILYRMN